MRTRREASRHLTRPSPKIRLEKLLTSPSSSTVYSGMGSSPSRATITRWISITTSVSSPYCRAWRSTRQSVCTLPTPPRCSHACAITARTIRGITAAICLPSTSISWEMKRPTLVRTALTLKRPWLSFTTRWMPSPAEQPTQGRSLCQISLSLMQAMQAQTIPTRSRIL